ncbi:MAG TPA: ABC transporter ATP-binding protein [Gemmataceae bacterium]|nr:ABC transporter ATP-binding protein [Gemmataceae bacterium]
MGEPGTVPCAGAALELEGVGFAFGGAPVLSGVSLRVEPGSFFSLLGPSGGGKTTLLRLVGGYLAPSAGRLGIGGRDVTDLPPERRNVGMVFQNYALFPHLSARGNVAFGLEMRQVPRRERGRRVEAMLDRVGLTAAERDRRPSRLSGGQQQRVALARALVIEPALLLLDEPLANLDRQLREQLRGELKALQRRTEVTTLFVTHDREEALLLADRVGILAAGRLLQVGEPRDVYHRPRCPFVARLLGDANLLPIASAGPDGVFLAGGLRLTRLPDPPGAYAPGQRILLRPEGCRPGAAGEPNCWPGRVVASHFLGADHVVALDVGPGVTLRMRWPSGGPPPAAGEAVQVAVPPEALWLIPEDDPEGMADGPS